MFSVYKITNLINNKCYIGSSIRVEERWKEHKRCAFNPNSKNYNYPLYQDIRKFNLTNFNFEIIKDDFNTVEEMRDYEAQMILYYDSLNNGYNQTLETKKPYLGTQNLISHNQRIRQQCAKVDKYNNILEVYQSYHDAARRNNLNGETRASSIREVCKGKVGSLDGLYFRDINEKGEIVQLPFKIPHGKKPLIRISLNDPSEEYFYDSISSAAKDLTNGNRRQIQLHLNGSSRFSTIQNYLLRELDIYGNIIENKILIEDKIKEYNNIHPLISGERHTIKEWCKIYNITTATYYYRLKKGMNQIEAITMKKRR